MPIDAVELEVIKASLSGIVQEMQNSLFRTGFSTIVRESQDASCALMNAQADVVAQHVVLPLHIGAFPACCAAVLEELGQEIAAGDAFRLVSAARDIDGDRHLNFRMQGDRHLMKADGFDRSIERDLTAILRRIDCPSPAGRDKGDD